MKIQKQNAFFLPLFLGSVLTFSGIASAHVTVTPKQSTTGAYEKYTFRMPVEKNVNTIGLRIEFPAGEKVNTVEPVPDWSYTFENDANGVPKAITWKATNGGIKPHEFMEFSLIGVNPKDPGTLTWKAYQTYADGSVVEWTGEPSAQTPAPVTNIQQGTSQGEHSDSHTSTSNTTTNNPVNQATQSSTAANSLPLYLSGAALLIAIISLFRKKA